MSSDSGQHPLPRRSFLPWRRGRQPEPAGQTPPHEQPLHEQTSPREQPLHEQTSPHEQPLPGGQPLAAEPLAGQPPEQPASREPPPWESRSPGEPTPRPPREQRPLPGQIPPRPRQAEPPMPPQPREPADRIEAEQPAEPLPPRAEQPAQPRPEPAQPRPEPAPPRPPEPAPRAEPSPRVQPPPRIEPPRPRHGEQPIPPAPREPVAAQHAQHQQPGEPLPRRGQPLPQRGDPLPQGGEPLPQRGDPLPRRGDPLPQRGEPLPQRGGPAEEPALPRRTTRTRRPGRHRSSHRLSVAPDAPPLVLAVPGRAAADTDRIGPRVAEAAELSCPGVDIRVGYTEGSELALADCLTEDGPVAADRFPSVIVPLLLSANARVDEGIARAAAGANVPTVLAEHLGPHPLVAEALHSRLAEAGLARTARAAGLSIAPGGRGIVVLADLGEEAMNGASVAAVLLASRLSVPVMPGSLGDPASIVTAIDRLNESGSQPVLAPCLIGPETSTAVLAELSAALGAPCAPVIGAHAAVSQLVAVRYGAALATLSVPR